MQVQTLLLHPEFPKKNTKWEKMNSQKAFTKPELCFISKKTWKIQTELRPSWVWCATDSEILFHNQGEHWHRVRNKPSRVTHSDFRILYGPVRSRAVGRPSEHRDTGRCRELGDLQLLGSSCSPDPSQPEPQLERSHLSFPGIRGIQQPSCYRVLAPGVLKCSLPQCQAHGRWGCPLLPSPLT